MPLQTVGKEMIDAAKKIRAGMVLLEQRYTGMSLPTREFSVATLKKLFKVPQSVKDVALFGEKTKDRLPGVKIILFGCSHGGTVAALARKYFSHIFDGAILSSAPLEIQLENEQYAEVLGRDFSNQELGGSDQCLGVLRDAHSAIGDRLSTPEGRQLLVEKFGLRQGDLEGSEAQTAFTHYGATTGVDLQYNDPECEKDFCNIRRICMRLTTGQGPPLDLLADIYKTNKPSRKSLVESIQQYLAMLKDDRTSDKKRMSFFDSCTSTGLFATCGHASCPFFTRPDRDWLFFARWVCEVGFGLSFDEIRDGIAEFNAYVGNFRGTTNILSINGNADPWYPSSIYEEGKGPEVEMVQDASHCYWCDVLDE
ncbi:Thymus-specific serine protease [Perkinsus chesapeaki]|uniref:Thymus-specific serine protease n=1 Tax=Perkinsus chesapeaki TaxID=330153 RepID=A0A7J6LIC5_PERCH|nr:Thymus-specific serine protease [Perkinsus chesapeaki]